MGFFKNRQEAQNMSARQQLEVKYAGARRDILLVLAFTVINIFLLVTNSNTYFLFSAYIPYAITDFAMYFCGKYPAEYYEGASMDLFGDGVFAVLMAAAALILVMYLLSWIFSNKGRGGWLIFALVLFGLDCVGLALMMVDMVSMGASFADYLFDILFHVWCMVSLIGGVSACYKLKKLPAEEEPQENYMDALVQTPAEEAEPVAPTEE